MIKIAMLKKYNTYYSLNDIKILSIISLTFFLIRWGTSFYFLNEDIITKILFESLSDGSFFYPLIKFLSNLDFNNSLNPLIVNLKTVPMPFGSIFIHSFFYKLLGISGLIIVDFFGIFLFFLIFFNIFKFFNTKYNSIFLAVTLYCMPLIIEILFSNYANTAPITQLKDFFSLRVHRPFPASLYFFSMIYLILIMNNNFIFKKRYFVGIGILLALSLSSFYYFFITEVILLSLFFFYKFNFSILKIFIRNYKFVLIALTSFLVIILPFIINIFYTENDVLISAAISDLTYDKKIYLLEYYLSKVLEIKFIILNIVIMLLVILIRKNNIKNYQISDIFYLVYLSTLLAPFIFLILSSKVGLLYHFNNNIVMYAFFSILISFILFINAKLKIQLNLFSIMLILTSLFFFKLFYKISSYEEVNLKRYEFNKIVKIINFNQKKNKLETLLTFNTEFMKWGILDDKVKYLNLTMVGMTPKNHNQQEKDLINVFKFLNLEVDDFLKFLENKKINWRYLNEYVATFFLHKYTANSLFRYNDSINFPEESKKFILNSSPLYSQQIAIPDEEFVRLSNKFITYENENFLKPDIIVLSHDLSFINETKINLINYCEIHNGKFYKVFINNKGSC